VVDVDHDVELLAGTEVTRVIFSVVEEGVVRATGELAADIGERIEGLGEQVDGAAEGRGPDGGCGAGGAVEVDAAEELRGEEGPGVVGGRVGVVEGDAVEVDVVVAIGEAAEVGGGLTEADAVAVGGEGAGGHFDGFAEVSDGRHEVLDHGSGDLGASRSFGELGVHGRERGSDGVGGIGVDCDVCCGGADLKDEGDVGGLVSG